MTISKKLAAALATVTLAASAAQAAPIPLNEWVFNPAGQGFESGQMVSEYLDTNGTSFFEVDHRGGTAVAIREHAALNIVQADSNGRLFPITYPGGNITAVYEAFGVGELGGAFRYTGGSLRLYQNPGGYQYATTAGIYGANLGTLIADLHIQGGGGELDASGNLVGYSSNTIIAQVSRGDLESGYFFRGDGSDLADAANLRFVLPTTYAFTAAWPVAVSEVACEFAGFTGPGCNGGDYRNVSGDHYLLGVNGQLKLGEVPEPGSLALFGVTLFAAAAAGRRKSAP
jgi:hypothetical protein